MERILNHINIQTLNHQLPGHDVNINYTCEAIGDYILAECKANIGDKSKQIYRYKVQMTVKFYGLEDEFSDESEAFSYITSVLKNDLERFLKAYEESQEILTEKEVS